MGVADAKDSRKNLGQACSSNEVIVQERLAPHVGPSNGAYFPLAITGIRWRS
jgi:hypothetical protein